MQKRITGITYIHVFDVKYTYIYIYMFINIYNVSYIYVYIHVWRSSVCQHRKKNIH